MDIDHGSVTVMDATTLRRGCYDYAARPLILRDKVQ